MDRSRSGRQSSSSMLRWEVPLLLTGGEEILLDAEVECSGPEEVEARRVLVAPSVPHAPHGSRSKRWEPEFAALLDAGSRLQRVASRRGVTTQALLDALAAGSAEPDPADALPASEAEALAAAGISLEGATSDPSGSGELVAGLLRAADFRREAVSVPRAAELLGVTAGRVRQLVADRAVATMDSPDASHLLPAWQFVDGQLVPGLAAVVRSAHGLHPLALAGFMGRPNVDLQVDGTPSTPVQWLVGGGSVDAVTELLAGLRVPS